MVCFIKTLFLSLPVPSRILVITGGAAQTSAKKKQRVLPEQWSSADKCRTVKGSLCGAGKCSSAVSLGLNGGWVGRRLEGGRSPEQQAIKMPLG